MNIESCKSKTIYLSDKFSVSCPKYVLIELIRVTIFNFMSKIVLVDFFILACFFFIGNTRTIINEKKKKKRQVQVVHDDEQQETNKTNNKTIEREIRKII